MRSNETDFYSLLKSRNDIREVASQLGFNGTRSGSYWHGECPKHGSEHGNCLVIWPRIQGFKCYHCGASGDVIGIVEHFKGCDHKTAVKFLAERAGIPLWGGRELSPEEQEQREKERQEKDLVQEILTEAAGWYHDQLKHYPDVKDHLQNHYRFSEEIIEELQIGFAPPPKADGTSELASYLNGIPRFKGKLAMSSLFTFAKPEGPFWDYFRGRITFPYWHNGKVVYMTARATIHTPVDRYDCITDNERNVKLDGQGRPDFIKYKKLRLHDPEDEKRRHISRFIRNDVFLGEDTIRGADEIVITEGVPDWISAVDKGFAAISPVTVNFRQEDLEKLDVLTRGVKAVYIINDNEENQAGLKGALNTGKFLTEKGRNVFLVELPKPKGSAKIDLNEYLKDHSAEELKALMAKAKSILQFMIDDLPADYLKAAPQIREEITPLLAELDEGIAQHYANLLANRVRTKTKIIEEDIQKARAEKVRRENEKKENEKDPEIEKAAVAISKHLQLFRERINVINCSGVVGERRNIAMYFCALDSRLLPEDTASPNALAIKNAGHFGAGKSYTIMKCLEIYPMTAFHLMTNGSAKSLYYLPSGLKHKALIVTEGFQFQENNAGDSELIYSIRSLISEGRVSYCVVQKDEEGKLITVEKKLEGPTSFITTTIMENLEAQLEDRLFTIHPDESIDQTKGILKMTADMKAGKHQGLDKKTLETWKEFHRSLKPAEVIVPFAPQIASFITDDGTVPISTRRAFKRVLIVIQSVTCAYQYQRQRDKEGRVIAEIADYWMSLQIVSEAFRETMGSHDKKTEERLTVISDKGVIPFKDLARELGISAAALSGWVKKRAVDGVIEWCDETGQAFVDDKDLTKAKKSGRAFLKISDNFQVIKTTGLPTPFDLTKDPRWDTNGDLLQLYDLDLEGRSAVRFSTAVKPVFVYDQNTINDSDIVESIDESDKKDDAVKVFSEKRGKDDNVSSPDIPDDNDIDVDEAMDAGRTPLICRKGCVHYDNINGNGNGKSGEFCWKKGGQKIQEKEICEDYQGNKAAVPKGILEF